MTAPRTRPIAILTLLALTNLLSYGARNALFAVYPTLRLRYHVDDTDLGLLTTIFLLPHAVATLVFGWAGDRFDRRRVIAAGLVLASLAGAAGALAPSYGTLAATRAITGFATAAVVPIANSILGQVFEGPKKASRMAIFNLGLFIGGVLGFGLGSALGFPYVVVALGVPGLALAVALISIHVPALPQTRTGKLSDFVAELVADAKVLLKIRTLRWILVSTMFMAFAAGGYNAWLKDFLSLPIARSGKGLSEAQSSAVLGIALLGGLSGILVGARLADRFVARGRANGRLLTIVAGMTLTIPAACAAILVPAGPGLYLAGFLTLFFISWYHAPMAATVDDLAPEALSVAAQGLVIFAMHFFGTAPSSFVVGAVSKATDLQTALWVPTAALVVAATCMTRATRTYAADRVL